MESLVVVCQGRRVFVVIAIASMTLAACSTNESSGARSSPTPSGNRSTSTTNGSPRPAGPMSTLTPLTGGHGVFRGVTADDALAAAGYVQREYAAAGTASSYAATNGFPTNGRLKFTPNGTASYRTRILVRRPADPARFSGTVAVEWLNVSGGFDSAPDWDMVHEDVMRRDDIWVGVSAQMIGVMGGPVLVTVPARHAFAGKGLRGVDPARYGSLSHPGDGYAFDIFTQVARAIRNGGSVLGGAKPTHLIAMGESQSAFALVTYIDGVQPLTHAFDGFFVHSRGASLLPIAGPGKPAGIADSIGKRPVIFRTDQRVPVLNLQTESDVAGFFASVTARQPDSTSFRLWEVAGTAHSDAHLLGPDATGLDCGVPVNNGPAHVVAKAAYNGLSEWVDNGTLPPIAPRLSFGPDHALRRDADGIAMDGIRTPPVDVPVDVLSSVPAPNAPIACVLSGSTKPLTSARLRSLYPSRDVYLQRYEADATRTIKAGFALAADRNALLAYAQPNRIKR
jgi:hypothetical protein